MSTLFDNYQRIAEVQSFSYWKDLNALQSISIDIKRRTERWSGTEMNGPDVLNLEDVGKLCCIWG